jgi:uncharacterized FlaG/YvyC family protein
MRRAVQMGLKFLIVRPIRAVSMVLRFVAGGSVMAVDEVQRTSSNSPRLWSQEKDLTQADAGKQPKAAPVPEDPGDPGAATKTRQEALQERKRVEAAAQQLNDFMKRNSIQLKFSVDDDTNEVVVKVVQSQTGKVIRQIPSEEALKIAKDFDSRQGLIVKQKV